MQEFSEKPNKEVTNDDFESFYVEVETFMNLISFFFGALKSDAEKIAKFANSERDLKAKSD